MRILITGAAGNLGGFLARHLLPGPTDSSNEHRLRLMVHRRPLSDDLLNHPAVEAVQADLGDPATLTTICEGVDVVVHFAGVLFRPFPERFLPITNTVYFKNLSDQSAAAGVRRVILISFPHTEGPTTPERPARSTLDAQPPSVHARTRLEEERYLLRTLADRIPEPVVLRAGTVYGKGVLMHEAARWLMRRRMMAVWTDPTWCHFLSLPDFLAATSAAITRNNVRGIYQLGDEQPMTIQPFLNALADHWGYARPWRVPAQLVYAGATGIELLAWVLRAPAPLTRDFIRIGMVSHVMDTSRMKTELLPTLQYPTVHEGLAIV